MPSPTRRSRSINASSGSSFAGCGRLPAPSPPNRAPDAPGPSRDRSAAADDDQMTRQLGVPKHRLVGEVRHALEPRDRRHGGPGSGRDDEAPGVDARPIDNNLARSCETGGALDYLDAEPLEPLNRVIGAIAAITSWTCRFTAAKSTFGGAWFTPSASSPRQRRAAWSWRSLNRTDGWLCNLIQKHTRKDI